MGPVCVDAQLPLAVCREIESLGYPAVHVSDVLGWKARDSDIWNWALENNATILSKDDDFAMRARTSRQAPSVIHLLIGNSSNRELRLWLRPRLAVAMARIAAGDRLVIME